VTRVHWGGKELPVTAHLLELCAILSNATPPSAATERPKGPKEPSPGPRPQAEALGPQFREVAPGTGARAFPYSQ
jgi:hypothetical protein